MSLTYVGNTKVVNNTSEDIELNGWDFVLVGFLGNLELPQETPSKYLVRRITWHDNGR